MIVCDLCMHYGQGSICGLELRIPKGMSCREFSPRLQNFCSNPNDFVDSNQMIEMATFFGMKGTELKKVKQMAIRAENSRLGEIS